MIMTRRNSHGGRPSAVARAMNHESGRGSGEVAADEIIRPARTVTGTSAGTRFTAIKGLLVVVGAIAFVVHLIARSALTAGVDPVASPLSDLWVPTNALGVIGAALVLLGLPAIFGRIAQRFGLAGMVGFALLEVSWMFFGLFLSLYGTLVLPWLAGQAPQLVSEATPTPLGVVVAFAVGLLAWLVGALLLSVPLLTGPARERWVGYLLPTSALWTVIGSFVIAPDGPAENFAVNLLSNLGPMLLLIGLGYLGLRAWADRTSAERLETDAAHDFGGLS